MSKTKFKNAETIVQDTFLNSIYGGLEGTPEGSSLPADDPRLIGHVHDGVSKDGHAAKINLVNHVDGQLTNTNLGDDAVTKRNVYSSTDPLDSNLIPHYEDAPDGTRHYFLNLGSFDLQGITDNGFQTTNEIVIGRNEVSSTYSSLLTIDLPLEVSQSGDITYKKDNLLNVMMSGKDLFNWNIVGPQKVHDPSAYLPGILDGNNTEYDESNIPWGIEQRITHDYFGYVSFVGASDTSFSLRLVGLGAEVQSGPGSTSMLGASPSDLDTRSFNSNPSLTFWYEDADANSADFGSQYVTGGISSVKTTSDDSDQSASNLLFSIKPDSSAKLSKNYPNSMNDYGSQAIDESDWPLIDVMKISKYGNAEIKRGAPFSSHSESLLNIKEVFGYSENKNNETSDFHNDSRNIASIRLEPVIGYPQVEGEQEGPGGGSQPVPLLPDIPNLNDSGKELSGSITEDGMGVVKNHNYIELASIMRSDNPSSFRVDGRDKSAEQEIVEHSNVFKFDRYFIDKYQDGDTHRALEDNTMFMSLAAKNHLPSVGPGHENFYAPSMMKINIVDGDLPRNFYIPVMYERGILTDYGDGGTQTEPIFNQSTMQAIAKQRADLSQRMTEYYLQGTANGSPGSTGYYYPLYLVRPVVSSRLISFAEFPGVVFYIPEQGSVKGGSSTPSSTDYPNIELYVNISDGNKYYD